MKPYPSIQSSNGQKFREMHSYVFDKLDGSNLRFEYSRKQGWHKFGTRNRLFDHTDPDFGIAIPIFLEGWQDKLNEVIKKNRWDHLIVFMEFFGEHSFAGKHDLADAKTLVLFDACPNKKGILGPKEFMDQFGHLRIPKFLGIHNWTRGFVERIRTGQDETSPKVTFEGVVGKSGTGHKLIMAKAKTQAWIDKVLSQYGPVEGKKIVDS
jgi:hypothetical protein